MKQKTIWIKWIFCLIPALIALIIYVSLPHFPKFTEYVFTRIIFRTLVFPLERFMSLLPFSVTEIIVVLSVPLIIALLILWITRIIRAKSRFTVFEKGLRLVAWCVSLALLIFMIADGGNFSRIPLSELLELPDGKYTATDLYTLTADLADKASAAREKLPESESGCTELSVSLSEILSFADNSYENLEKSYPFLKTAVKRVKPVRLSHLWSYTGTTGVYCPWLAEASVNTDVPVFSISHTAAHEIAHTMGFAKENECNFLAWLACSTCNQPDYEYSGYTQAFIYCANALYKADKELWRQAYSHCSDGMLRDLEQNRDYWKSFEGEVMESSQSFNDSFIKANGVESGVLSYNQMVELMLRYYDKTLNNN